MPSSPESFPHVEGTGEITDSRPPTLPLFGEIFEGRPVDINFIETWDYFEPQITIQEGLEIYETDK